MNSDAVNFHSLQAQEWEAGYNLPTFSVRLEVLKALLPTDLSGQLWLDAGCGTGPIARWLADRGASVMAVDASPEMLANAPTHARVQYQREDITQTSFPDAYFEGIVCSSVVEYLDDPAIALNEFKRILKPQGSLVISVPSSALSVRIPLWLVYWLTRPLGKKRWFTFLDHSKQAFSPMSLDCLLAKSGFLTKRAVTYGSLGLPYGIPLGRGSLIMALATAR